MKIAAMIGAPDLEEETLAIYSGDLETAFAKVAALGYDGVELMTKEPKQLDGVRIKRWLDEQGLELAGLCTGHVYGEDELGLVDPDAQRAARGMARLQTFVDFAAEHFGAGTLVNIGRSRGPGYPGDMERTLREMAEKFRELAEYARPHGIRLVLEPINVHQVNHIHTTQEGIEMVRRVDHANFGLMLDVYHMNIEDVDIYDSFRAAGDLCWFVHFTDNNRKYPGSAHLDFAQIVAVLREIGYDGYISNEILPWPNPDMAARETIAFLRQYVPGGRDPA